MEELKSKRTDCWECCMSDEQQRELYSWVLTPFEDEAKNSRRPNFDECMEHLDAMGVKRPSYNGWFRFKARMEKDRRREMLYSIKGSGESAKDLAAMSPADYELAADTFTNMAIDAGIKGNEKAVSIFSNAARLYQDKLQQDKKLDLQSRAQQTKDEQLKLAREKFEFDAAKKAMELAAEIKTVASDDSLNDDEKIAKVREALFGSSHTSQQS